MAGLNAFVLLNLTVDSTPEDVRKAFRRMVLLHHPDKGGAAEVFRDMKQAYEILADDATKRQHWLAGHVSVPTRGACLSARARCQTDS